MELDEEGAAAPKMRWLAILGGPHPPLDQAPDLGPLAELGDSVEVRGTAGSLGSGGHASLQAPPPPGFAAASLALPPAIRPASLRMQLLVLRSPTLDALAAAVKEFGPTAVYAYGGSPGRSEDVERQSVAPLGLLLDDQGARQPVRGARAMHAAVVPPSPCKCMLHTAPASSCVNRSHAHAASAAGAVQEAAVEAFAAVFAGLGLDVLFLDFAVRHSVVQCP